MNHEFSNGVCVSCGQTVHRKAQDRHECPTAHAEEPRCIAPISEVDAEDFVLCGKPATTTRLAEGLECPLCEAHAREFDKARRIELEKLNRGWPYRVCPNV